MTHPPLEERIAALAGDAIHQGEHHTGEHQGQVDDHHPHQIVIGMLLDVDEVLQQFDAGNGDDGTDQLEFEVGEADMAHPVRPVFMFVRYRSWK
jgi:hypothetical protein